MKLSIRLKNTVLLTVSLLLLLSLSCKKKTQPIARGPEPGPTPVETTSRDYPSPTIELNASPTTLRRGEEATLSWRATSAETVVIDAGVGNVEPSGSVGVSPLESTTYTAIARGRGGEARASARITVVRDEGKPIISATDIEGLKKAIEEGLINPVFFAYDSAELSAEARSTLEENSRWFRRFPDAQIVLEGHCDERGTEEYNLALGESRARTTREYLVQLGINPARLEPVSFGEERPFVKGSNEAAWAKNRRTHFVVR